MPNTRKILIVDDDPGLRDALTEQLSLHEEFEALAVENGSKGVQAAKVGQIDLVIMDVGLPDIDGREAVRILRKNGFKAPIIMLTGHETDSDTILGRKQIDPGRGADQASIPSKGLSKLNLNGVPARLGFH
jgi:DNA-binding response OmpR family regulator